MHKHRGLGGDAQPTAEAPWPERLSPWGAATAPTTTETAACPSAAVKLRNQKKVPQHPTINVRCKSGGRMGALGAHSPRRPTRPYKIRFVSARNSEPRTRAWRMLWREILAGCPWRAGPPRRFVSQKSIIFWRFRAAPNCDLVPKNLRLLLNIQNWRSGHAKVWPSASAVYSAQLIILGSHRPSS